MTLLSLIAGERPTGLVVLDASANYRSSPMRVIDRINKSIGKGYGLTRWCSMMMCFDVVHVDHFGSL